MAAKKFKVHNMYSKTGEKKVASTLAQHNALKKKGYTHTKKNDAMNLKQMKEVVKQLKGASKMHAQQAAKIEKMIKSQTKK
jgi:hypothetical protein